jgi:hypothetical protein
MSFGKGNLMGRREGTREGAHRRVVTIATIFAILGAAWAPAGQASTGDIIAPSDPNNPKADSGWQAGTCTKDVPDTPEECSVDTPTQFFEQASGHPPFGFTQFIVKNKEPGQTPVGELKTVRVDLPVGLSVNPGATPQCPLATFEADHTTCPAGSEVGESFVTASVAGVPKPLPGEPPTVYNLVPKDGEPALFGFNLAGNNVYLQSDVAWDGDYHEGFTIDVPETPFAKLPPLEGLVGGVVLKNRLVFDGTSGDGTFITTPTTCLGKAVPGPFEQAYSTWLLASSVKEEKEPGYVFPESARPPFESRIPPGTFPKECDSIPFDPSIAVDPSTTQTDSPSGASVTVDLPNIKDPGKEEMQASSQAKAARVTMPAGMGLNPSAANGLEACTDAQFGKGTKAPVACPTASKIGTVSVETPPLPEGPVTGDVYVGQQLSRDPASGDAYRIFVDIESARYGISARLIGNASADPVTGQLTTTLDGRPLGGLPQVPFSSFMVKLDDGSKAPLTSPPTCGPNATSSEMTPWSSTPGALPAGEEGGPSDNPPATPTNEFSLADAPGGGACAKTLAERPFGPSFAARTVNPQAGAFSPFEVEVARSDGNQELKGVDVDLPPGLSAKLAGVRYCPESAIAAAAANGGAAEAAVPSCPESSLIGSAIAKAGTGPDPIQIAGKAFLAGPYDGAPLSLVVVTPATAGPFDLGSVVVRVALFVDPATAQVHAVSDPIPHVFGGALLDIRSVTVKVDRPQFSLNPTNCSPMAVGGTLRGGGANPLDPAAFSALPVSTPFQVSGCEALGFKPKLFLRVFGGTRRAKNPKLRAVFLARAGDANVGRAAVTLPRSFFLDQASLSKVCTRVQFAADECPKNSIYGYARAITPLLDGPLKGPVYLRSSDNLLPDLVAALRGQVEVELAGRTDTVNGRIRNTFDVVPDVPVSKFILTVRGGKKGLLVNSRSLCGQKGKIRAVARFKAQNGKKANMRPKLRTPCGAQKQARKQRR